MRRAKIPSVARIIGDMLAARRPFTPAILQELRERTSPRERTERAVGTIGANVTSQIDEVIAKLEAASKGAEDYGHALSAARGELGGAQSPDHLRKLVGNLISATKEMESALQDPHAGAGTARRRRSKSAISRRSSTACARKA